LQKVKQNPLTQRFADGKINGYSMANKLYTFPKIKPTNSLWFAGCRL